MPVSGELRSMSHTQFPTRNMMVERLGTPDQVLGSLNDPRTHEENGYRFNERWLYEHLRDDPAGVPMRVVYWHRYDFVATMVRANDKESWRSDETLVQALKDHASRLAPLDP